MRQVAWIRIAQDTDATGTGTTGIDENVHRVTCSDGKRIHTPDTGKPEEGYADAKDAW